MPRIIYACTDNNVPSGGVKVIYKHVDLLRSLGHDAHVMHFTEGFRCTWFDNDTPIIHPGQLQLTDLVVVPEVLPAFANQLHGLGIRYCMFVQNGYLVLPSGEAEVLDPCYRNAVALLSISNDTSHMLRSLYPDCADKIVQVRYSVDVAKFQPGDKTQTVTYMPRKLPLHAANVVGWLRRDFPQWNFQPLHGLSEDQVAAAMRSSRIFLAFSDFEGCPVPPIEAALAGNIVLGYPGWGGMEYWQEPNFRTADFGDVRDFVRKFHEVADFAQRPHTESLLRHGMQILAQHYGKPAELTNLQEAMTRILALTGGEQRQAA